MKVHQILSDFHPGDAIGNETILIQKIFRESGYESEVFCKNHHHSLSAHQYNEYPRDIERNRILIYHHSIGSDIAEFIKDLPDKKMMIYHNITPAHFFAGINEHLFYLLEKGRQELCDLTDSIQLAVGDSEYNRQELENVGYPCTDVLPILLDFTAYSKICLDTLKSFSDDWINILFVGRISPNKAYEDVIKTFYYYKLLNPKSRLLLPGSYQGTELYYDSLQKLVQKLRLTDVHFFGKINLEELVAYYKCADIFLCMSEHEGFNVPLLESMYFDIPIIAYNTCAIPYTLGDAGILINSKEYGVISELINIVVNDKDLSMKILKKQKKQLEKYNLETNKIKLKNLITFIMEHDYK